ncbi:hypothetical protein D1007_58015 [Hordeum vulgare]|nr:hypothetical protein D1007_58015 [Hordeum vulgare]
MEALQREVAEAWEAHTKQVSKAKTKLTAREEEVRSVANAKAAVDRVMLSSLELRACRPLSSICRLGLESPFVRQDACYAEFCLELVKELEGAAKKVDIILEEECHDLFSVFNHLLLRGPHFEFKEVMVPVP